MSLIICSCQGSNSNGFPAHLPLVCFKLVEIYDFPLVTMKGAKLPLLICSRLQFCPVVGNKGYCPICFCFVIVRCGLHKFCGFVFVSHHVSPLSSFSISSVVSSMDLFAVILLLADGVSPNCSQNLSIILRLVCAMETCGTCCK